MTVVPVYYAMYHGQTHPTALTDVFCAKKRIKNFMNNIIANAVSGVFYAELQIAAGKAAVAGNAKLGSNMDGI